MPGFIDPHIHPSMAGLILSMELITPLDWALPDRAVAGVRTEAGYRARLAGLVAAAGQDWVFTWGYHHYWHGSLTRGQLDAIAPATPVLVWHRSFHELVLNSKAIEALE